MNQNYVNLNLIFLIHTYKNILLKVSSFLFEPFQFTIVEKCYIQKHNLFVTMRLHPSLMLLRQI